MSLFFDADWFDARLADQSLGRNELAACAGIDRTELHRLYSNERAPTGEEQAAFAQLLGVDMVEIGIRCGVANREAPPEGDTGARIDSIEARLDAIDQWLAELEAGRRRRA